MFEGITAASDSKIDAYLDRCRTVRFEGDSGFFDDFITSLQANFFKVLLSCTCILRFISGFMQTFFVIAFKIMAPVVLGLAAWEPFRSRLYQFITYTLAVTMWSVGYQIADVFILNGIALVGVPKRLEFLGWSNGCFRRRCAHGTARISACVFFIGMCYFLCSYPASNVFDIERGQSRNCGYQQYANCFISINGGKPSS